MEKCVEKCVENCVKSVQQNLTKQTNQQKPPKKFFFLFWWEITRRVVFFVKWGGARKVPPKSANTLDGVSPVHRPRRAFFFFGAYFRHVLAHFCSQGGLVVDLCLVISGRV